MRYQKAFCRKGQQQKTGLFWVVDVGEFNGSVFVEGSLERISTAKLSTSAVLQHAPVMAAWRDDQLGL
jgi:hypothetical protein